MRNQTIDLVGLFMLTLQSPRQGGEAVLKLNLSQSVLWQALMLVSIIPAILLFVSQALVEPDQALDELTVPLLEHPVLFAVTQFMIAAGMVAAIHYVGRFFGGQGLFADSLALVVWLQAIMTMVQIIQFVLLAASPLLSVLVVYASVVLFFVLLTAFVQTIHGFQSAGAVFGMIIMSMIALLVILSLILNIFGIVEPIQMGPI